MFQNKSSSEKSSDQLKQQLEVQLQRSLCLLETVQALLYFLKEFSFDYTEIGADQYKNRLNSLAELLKSNESPSFLREAFDDNKEFILNFIGKERQYIEERESELKEIITLLRDGIYSTLGEAKQFSAKMYKHNVEMEKLIYLDDMKKIKQTLHSEIDEMRQTIVEKQASESRRIESLSKEVTLLKLNLEKIKDASLTDSLTGAFNRLAFDTHLRRHLERNTVAWYPFSVLMCDIDNFKTINDTYGHQIGDRVLICFVQQCKEFFRSDDIIARYGGEEFAMILPGMSLRNAMKRARIFCKNLASKQFVIDAANANEKITFTVSIGVSEAKEGDTPELLIERADQALYSAKRAGKNRAIGENGAKSALPAKVCSSLSSSLAKPK